MGENISFWALGKAKFIFWPAVRFELCTPGLYYYVYYIALTLGRKVRLFFLTSHQLFTSSFSCFFYFNKCSFRRTNQQLIKFNLRRAQW